MVNENCVASIIASLTQTDSDAWCKRAPIVGFKCCFYSGQPESPSHLLQFIAEVHTFYIQQRSLIKPVIVHCR